MDAALVAVGVLAALVAALVHWPLRRPGELAALVFPVAWWAGELPVHWAVVVVTAAVACVAGGALASGLGGVGLGLTALGLVGPVASWREATLARARASALLGEPVRARAIGAWRWLVPAWFGDRAVVRRGVRIGGRAADVYQPRGPGPGPAPALVYVHGGGWVLGFRRFQGRLLIRRLVRAGWVAVSVEYRRWPARWPAHVDDVRAALAWVHTEAAALGVDPGRVAVSGNSAGAHLAALATLMAPRAPVAACVAWYGVYDLLDEARAWRHGAFRRLWELAVMRARMIHAADRFRAASPVHHLDAAAPPFLVIHGTHDTLIPVAAARDFVRRLDAFGDREGRAAAAHRDREGRAAAAHRDREGRAAAAHRDREGRAAAAHRDREGRAAAAHRDREGRAAAAHRDREGRAAGPRVTYFEVPGAQHAFDVFTSRRGAVAVELAARWLERHVGSAR